MTIIEAINEADSLRKNSLSYEDKIRCLSRVEAQVYREVLAKAENAPEFPGFSKDSDQHTELAMPEPYCEAYVRFLEAQVDLMNGEMPRYNSTINAFNEIYGAYKRWYIRTNPQPRTTHRYF